MKIHIHVTESVNLAHTKLRAIGVMVITTHYSRYRGGVEITANHSHMTGEN